MATALEVSHVFMLAREPQPCADDDPLVRTIAGLAALPWIRTTLNGESHARPYVEQRLFSSEIRAAALRVLARAPACSPGRDSAFTAAIDECASCCVGLSAPDCAGSLARGEGHPSSYECELAVGEVALHELTALVVVPHSDSCVAASTTAALAADWLPRFRELATVCPPMLVRSLALCVAIFACIEGGHANSR